MSKWRCVVLVPMAHDIEYATTLDQAVEGAKRIRDWYKPVPEAGSTTGQIEPKIVVILGPTEDVERYAAVKAEERKAREPAVPTLTPEPPSDGPLVA